MGQCSSKIILKYHLQDTWSGLIQMPVTWYRPALGAVKSPGCSEHTRTASNMMEVGGNERRGKNSWLSTTPFSCRGLKIFCIPVLRKGVGRWTIIPKTEGGGEAEPQTESRGSATKSCSTCAGPKDKHLRVRGTVSLFLFFPLLFWRPQTQTLVALNHGLETGRTQGKNTNNAEPRLPCWHLLVGWYLIWD